MDEIDYNEFLKVELRVGRVIDAAEFPEAQKPAIKLTIDFGETIGIKKSSAQITEHYSPENLKGRLVVGVVNLPDKQIGPMISECLVTGFHDPNGNVFLCSPDGEVPLGSKLL